MKMKTCTRLCLILMSLLSGCGFVIESIGKQTSSTTNPSLVPSTPTHLSQKKYLFATTYTGLIYAFLREETTGALTPTSTPTFATGNFSRCIAADPTGKFIYTVSSNYSGTDSINGFSIDPATDSLVPVSNIPVVAGGANSIAVSPSGTFVFVGLYTANAVAAYSRNITTGELTEVAGSPFGGAGGPAGNGTTIHPNGQFVYVAENNGTDMAPYSIGASGALAALTPAHVNTGLSPLASVFRPDGLFMYMIGWSTGGVRSYSVNGTTGAPTSLGATTVAGTNPFGIAINALGTFLYVSNNTTHNISGFAIDPTLGTLAAVPGSPFSSAGVNPRNAKVDPSNSWLYVVNISSPNISQFAIDASTGALTLSSQTTVTAGPQSMVLTTTPWP